MNAGHAYKQAAAVLEQLPERLLSHADFGNVTTALGRGEEATIDGVWGSSCALAVAALLLKTDSPMLVLVPQLSQVDALVDDLGLFGVNRVSSLPAPEGALATLADQEGADGQRVRTLKQLLLSGKEAPRAVVSSIQGMLRPVPDQHLLVAASTLLKLGDLLDIDRWLEQLVQSGYSATSAVAMPGEFSCRGGIIDLFARDWERPVRIELFGDQVESIRRFDIDSQRSLESLEQLEMTVGTLESLGRDCVTSYFPEESWVVMIEPAQGEDVGKQFLERLEDPHEAGPPAP